MQRIATMLLTLIVLLLCAACARTTGPTALVDYRDEEAGFSIRHPDGWTRASSTSPNEVRFVPADAQDGGEFISVYTLDVPEGNTEEQIRQRVFNLLPIHGVSGFQQDARTTPDVLWMRFEVTGSTTGVEWASVGVAAAGTTRTQVAVCAKPLPRWREGQAQCDEVIRSFRPGNLEVER